MKRTRTDSRHVNTLVPLKMQNRRSGLATPAAGCRKQNLSCNISNVYMSFSLSRSAVQLVVEAADSAAAESHCVFPPSSTCSGAADPNAECIWVREPFPKYYPLRFTKASCFDIECNTYISFTPVHTRHAHLAQPLTFRRPGLVVDFVVCSFPHCTGQKLMNGCFDFTAVHEASDG